MAYNCDRGGYREGPWAKKAFNYTRSKTIVLPMIQTTAAIIAGSNMVSKTHLRLAALNEFTPASSVLDLGTSTTVCRAMSKVPTDPGKDIMTWALVLGTK